MDQSRAPIMEALENFKDMRIVPFDVPGHKRGRGSPELTKFLGQQCMTVDCGCEMDGVGFTAARKMILLPSLIPPRTPPAWLVSLVILPSFVWKESLLILPFVSAALKPSPISKPLTAPMDSIALARLASSFSNTVSPIPTGIPVITHSMMPPEES